MPNSSLIRPLGALASALGRAQNRLYSNPQPAIAGVDDRNWPSALQPISPFGPPGSEAMGMNLWMGQNLIYTPRPDAEYSAVELQKLATYPLARFCIENVKDQICDMHWKIQAKMQPGETEHDRDKRQAGDGTISKLSKMLEYPDPEHEWPEWVRPLLEDMLSIDAGSVLLRRNMKKSGDRITAGDKIMELRVVPGESITRYVDDNGYTPQAPSVAYAQLWEGFPRVDLTTDQLVYKPRNIVRRGTLSSQLYGFGPTEQGAEEIKIGRERLDYVLKFYTHGSTPGLVQMVPAGTPPDKILEAMQWMNSELAGNLASRRQWRYAQSFSTGDKTDEIKELRDPVLADAFDDLHIRKICFMYGTGPQRLLKAMNRASAEASQSSADMEGLMPWLSWLRGVMNYIIQRKMGFSGYEMVWDTAREMDVEKQANAIKTLVSGGTITENEGRDKLGMAPNQAPEANQLGVVTATGWVPIAGSIDRIQQAHDAAIAPPKLVPRAGNQTGAGPDDPPTPPQSKKKVAKASEITINPKRDTGAIRQARDGMRLKVHFWLQRQARKASAVKLSKLSKAKDDVPDIEAIVESILNEIDFSELADIVEPDMLAASIEGASFGISDLSITDDDVISAINAVARDYASERSAEMVGMKRVDGKLVENPNAAARIDESTRNMIRATIKEAFEGETKVSDLAAVIRESGAFSEARAALIAENEVRQAQIRGNLASWKASGVVEEFRWQLSGDHSCCDICDDFAEGGPYPLKDAEKMLDETHILCACILVAAKIKGVEL